MAVDKRNGPASSGKENQALREEELGSYGVWVKSEPRDVSAYSDSGFKAVATPSAEDLEDSEGGFESVSEVSETKDETFLSLEEETLLEGFDLEDSPSEKDADGPLDMEFSVKDIQKGHPSAERGEETEIDLDALESEDFPEPSALGRKGEAEEMEIESLDLGGLELDSTPESVSPDGEELLEEFSVPDFSISESDAEAPAKQEELAAQEDSFDALMEAEEIDLGDIPAIEMEEEAESLEEVSEDEPEKNETGGSPVEEELSLEDFGMDSESSPTEKVAAKKGDGSETSEVSLEDFVDIESFGVSMDDGRSKDGDEELEPIEMDLDFDDSIESQPLSMAREREGSPQSFEDTLGEEQAPAYSGPAIATEEVNDFDDFLKSDSQPQIVKTGGKQEQAPVEHALDVSGEFIDSGLIEEADAEDQTGLISEADGIAISIDGSGPIEEEKRPMSARTSLFDSETDEALSSIETIAEESSLDAIPSAVEELPDFEFAAEEEPSVEAMPAEGDFDDLRALEDSLSEVTGDGAQSALDSQNSILQKIANELSTIKDELASLKDELSSIKAGSIETAQAEDSSSKKPVGFFDEEEDETIALTGDELDNILNTADFTEETGAPHEAAEASETDDLIPLDEKAKPSFEKVSLGAEGKPAAASSRDDRGLEDLKRINDQGLAPMTEAPEDTSYLEEPIDEDLESMTLPDTPLEEPDLSAFEVSDEGGAVSDEKGIDLLEKSLTEDEEPLDDITLDLDSDSGLSPDILAENADLGGLAAPFPEPDQDISEISLADDSSLETEELEELPDIGLGEETEVPQAKAAAPALPEKREPPAEPRGEPKTLPPDLKNDIKSVLQYMDRLLESLPEDKIEEFAHSEHFGVYKKLFEELGLL